MYRYLCLLPLLLLVGCRGGDGADGSSPAVDEVSTDGTVDGAATDGEATDGTSADGTPHIVTPTEDDSQQRAKVRQMEMAQLVEALDDPELSDAATDELASRGSDAVKPLVDALESSDETVQQRAIFTLGQLGPAAKDALPKLKQLASESNAEVIQDSAKFAIDAIEGN